jgi:hypothetical protein
MNKENLKESTEINGIRTTSTGREIKSSVAPIA